MANLRFPRHFDGRRFYNPDTPQARGFLDVLRWKLSSRSEPSPELIWDVEQSTPPRCLESSQLRITLVNHSTVLIQQRAFNIVTDPIWSERASPVSWLGPKRRRKPGVRMDDLPDIDGRTADRSHSKAFLDRTETIRLDIEFLCVVRSSRFQRRQFSGQMGELAIRPAGE